MPCALNGEVIALHTWRNMHPSTPLPQQQLDRLARDIELAAFDEESVAIMAVIEYVTSFETHVLSRPPVFPRDEQDKTLSKPAIDCSSSTENRPADSKESSSRFQFEIKL